MEFKHTPAPWDSVVSANLELPSGIIKSGKKSIAHTLQKEVGAEQAKANANLIAAAPELLEALQEIVGNHYLSDKAQSMATKAIAKALGQQ